MDIYVPRSGIRSLGGYVATHGYQYLGGGNFLSAVDRRLLHPISSVYVHGSVDDEQSHIVGIFPFASSISTRSRSVLPHIQQIRLILTRGEPINAVLAFPSTEIMNCIFGNCAMSIFPLATFRDRISVQCKLPRHPIFTSPSWTDGYRGPPFRVISTPYDDSVWTRELVYPRFVGDRFTWIVDYEEDLYMRTTLNVPNGPRFSLAIEKDEGETLSLESFVRFLLSIVSSCSGVTPEVDGYITTPAYGGRIRHWGRVSSPSILSS
ncbi:hypothetical protein PLICRDRAFT_176929 [Plicaturopsis crispa FD-325 SS-3]|nr:hypothetical protein PLICRDRAFT_176929 [Plicaturopsis crispa FD-325 SS-3]